MKFVTICPLEIYQKHISKSSETTEEFLTSMKKRDFKVQCQLFLN